MHSLIKAKIFKNNNFIIDLFSSFSSLIVNNLLSIFSIGIAIKYFSKEEFGLWNLITGVVVYLSLSNLGLNSVSYSFVIKQSTITEKIRMLYIIFIISALSSLFFLTAYLILDYNFDFVSVLGKIPGNLMLQATIGLKYTILFFFATSFFSIIGFSQFGLFHIDKIFELFQGVISFIILLYIVNKKYSIAEFCLFTGIGRFSISFIKFVYFYFKYSIKNYNWSTSFSFKKNDVKIIFLASYKYFFASLFSIFVWNIDSFVIAHYLNLSDVGDYNIHMKLFMVLFLSAQFLIGPKIQSIIQSFYVNSNTSIKDSILNSIKNIISIIVLPCLIIVLFGENIFEKILDKGDLFSPNILILVTVLSITSIPVYFIYSLINGLGIMKYAPFVILFEGIINFIFSILLVNKFGFESIICIKIILSLIVYFLYVFILRTESNSKILIKPTQYLKFIFSKYTLFLILAIFLKLFIHSTYPFYVFASIIVIVYSYLILAVLKKYITNV